MAARLVLGLTLVVITATAPKAAAVGAVGALLLSAAVKAGRAIAGYVDREFIQQRGLALAVLPFWAALVWLAFR